MKQKNPTPKKTKVTNELKRRNVLRVSLVYILTSIAIWKGAGVIGLPQNILQIVPFILIILFPISILMAWLYERSPQGFIKTGSAASRDNPFTDSQKKPLTSNTFISLLLVTVVALFLIYPQSSTEQVVSEEIDKSIAVIPFTNMSDDKDQQYFADGVMEDILTQLQKMVELRVISRTSVEQYRNTDKSAPVIGDELNVSYLLEGSVRKAANQIMITAQLIKAGDDSHIWADNFTSEYSTEGLFDIQRQIAENIVAELKLKISPEKVMEITQAKTENMQAYNLFLEARFLLSDIFDQTQYSRAYELLEQAIAIDPDFALAYTQMAGYWITRGVFTGIIEREKVLEEAIPLLEKSLELNDKEPFTYSRLGSISLWFHLDFKKAEMAFTKVRELSPSYVITTDYFLATGRYKEALAESNKQLKNDVNSPAAWVSHGLSLYFVDRIEESRATFEQAIQKFPNHSNLLSEAGRVYVFLNENHKAIKILEPHLDRLERRPPRNLGNLAIAYYKTNQDLKSKDILEEMKQMSQESSVGSPAFYIAMLYAQMEEIDVAFEWLEKAYQEHEVEMYWLKVEPPFEPLRSDPRWQEMLDKVGFPD